MKIDYITTYAGDDIHRWSGTGFHIRQMLEQQNNSLVFHGNYSSVEIILLKITGKILRNFNVKFDYQRTLRFASLYGKYLKKDIGRNSDLIFSPGSIPIAFLETAVPKVFYTDATFGSLLNFYNDYTGLPGWLIKSGQRIEQEAIDSCSLAIYSSEWAARSAITQYGANPSKVKIVPFGANVEVNRTISDIRKIVNERDRNICNLLFIGVEWERKGGDFAIEVAKTLHQRGTNVHLHILGIPKLPVKHPPKNIINHGFISKSTEEGRRYINNLLMKSHFFLLPTKADCTPIVIGEVNSFGIPCLSSNVGGLPSLVFDGLNGMKFKPDVGPIDFADYILQYTRNYDEYMRLCETSFETFASLLNWKTAGLTIMKHLKEIQ